MLRKNEGNKTAKSPELQATSRANPTLRSKSAERFTADQSSSDPILPSLVAESSTSAVTDESVSSDEARSSSPNTDSAVEEDMQPTPVDCGAASTKPDSVSASAAVSEKTVFGSLSATDAGKALTQPASASNYKTLCLRLLAAVVDATLLAAVVAPMWSAASQWDVSSHQDSRCTFGLYYTVVQDHHFFKHISDLFAQQSAGEAFGSMVLYVFSAIACLVPAYPFTWLAQPLRDYFWLRPSLLSLSLLALPLFLGAVYSVVLESSKWQGTLGKRLLGLKTSDKHGKRLTVKAALFRFLAKQFTFAPLGIWLLGFVLPGRRFLHDLVSHTAVIADSSSDRGKKPVLPLRAKLTIMVISLVVLCLLAQTFRETVVDVLAARIKIANLERQTNRNAELMQALGNAVEIYTRNQQFDQAGAVLQKLRDLCRSAFGNTDLYYLIVLRKSELNAVRAGKSAEAAQLLSELESVLPQ